MLEWTTILWSTFIMEAGEYYPRYPSPEEAKNAMLLSFEISNHGAKILYLAGLYGLIPKALKGNLFVVVEEITALIIDDQRPELHEIGDRILALNESRERIGRPGLSIHFETKDDGSAMFRDGVEF